MSVRAESLAVVVVVVVVVCTLHSGRASLWTPKGVVLCQSQ